MMVKIFSDHKCVLLASYFSVCKISFCAYTLLSFQQSCWSMSVASVGKEAKSQSWVLNPQVSAAEHCDGFPVYSLTGNPECCGCVLPEPKLIHSFDASVCCALIFSAPRTSRKVWAGCHHAHGALISCLWSWQTARQHQLLQLNVL